MLWLLLLVSTSSFVKAAEDDEEQQQSFDIDDEVVINSVEDEFTEGDDVEQDEKEDARVLSLKSR